MSNHCLNNETLKEKSKGMFQSIFSLVTSLFVMGTNSMQSFSSSSPYNFLISGILLIVFNYLLGKMSFIFSWIRSKIKQRFVTSVTVNSKDEIHSWISQWILQHKYSKNCSYVHAYSSFKCGIGGEGNFFNSVEDLKTPTIYYFPGYGTHFLNYKGYIIWITRGKVSPLPPVSLYGNGGTSSRLFFSLEKETLILSCFSLFRTKILEDLIDHCKKEFYKDDKTKSYILTNDLSDMRSWNKSLVKKHRSLESVILPQDQKKTILNDIQSFMKSGDFYKKLEIPYRRGYLLFGIPGTGKTSLILAIAGYLKLSVCRLNLNVSGLDDNSLWNLLQRAPIHSIIVLEDIESCLLNNSSGEELITTRDGYLKKNGKVTLSGLLNAIDGIGSNEGQLIFMTTNHVKSLPKSLIRDGRIDMKIEFKYATKYQIEHLFLRIYPENKEIATLLIEKIPDGKLTCAQLQGFYLKYREDPTKIVDHVEEYLKKI